MAPMDLGEARVAIAMARGSEPRSVRPIGDGWDHWTFLVDDRDVFRFPRREDSARSIARELRLLPDLAARVDFRIPEPSVIGSWNRYPFMGYPRIEGRPLAETDGDRPATLSRLVEMIGQIHAVPVDRAAGLLGAVASTAPWVAEHQHLAAETSSTVAPLLPLTIGKRLEARFEAFLDVVTEFTPVLVHADLGPEHVLIHEETLEPVGLIDFGDATIGDPAIDFVGFRIAFGPRTAREMAARSSHGDADGFTDRIDAYWWMDPVHAVLHGIAEDDESLVREGLSRLTRRLVALDDAARGSSSTVAGHDGSDPGA